MRTHYNKQNYNQFKKQPRYYEIWQYIHIDRFLFFFLLLISFVGLGILYSASNQNFGTFTQQVSRLCIAFLLMLIIAQIPPNTLRRWAPWIYGLSLGLLIVVLFIGHIGKGAQRWLTLGGLRLQPAELMKLAIPLILASYYQKILLPLKIRETFISFFLIFIPVILTAKQPDLSTALLLLIIGASILFLAGISWRFLSILGGLFIISTPILWFFMRGYQRQRILTFFNPERDPLGAGYHIIQSKIALGSGGMFGKGWLNGTQSHLHFLPEHKTDFIFAVCGEEFGLIGCLLILTLYLLIVARGFYIALYAQDTFSRLLAGSLTLSFLISFCINISMVTGILPVAGVPLPFISYGGSSLMTLMMSFGMLMSIETHKKLITT